MVVLKIAEDKIYFCVSGDINESRAYELQWYDYKK